MKTFNPYLKFQSTNHTCESALLVQIRSAVESLRSDWKTLGKDPLKAAVKYFADEHGLSCHLLCWLAYWYESDPAAKQLQLLDAFLVLLENAIAGSIPDAEAHRNAAQLLLADESCLEEAAMMFRVCASASLKGTDPRHLAQWNNDSSPSVSVERSIWTAASPKPASQPSLFDVPGPSPIQPIVSPGTAKPEILPAGQPCPAATQHSGQNPPMLSRSQTEVLATMRTMLAVFRSGSPSLAGITPRFHPLLVGPTGAGKTFLAGELARRAGLPLINLNVGSWVVSGGHRPTTPQLLARFVDENESGVIFVDEVDKIEGSTDWMRYVQQEVFALLDGRLGDFPDFSRSLNEKLRRGFFIVGAGTWQALQPPVLRHAAYAEPPFGPLPIPVPKLQAALEGQKSIGDELLLRFNCQVLHIEPMGRVEIRERVEDICRAGGHGNLRQDQIEKLVGEVLASRVPQRALESLVTRIQTHNATRSQNR